MATKHEHEKHRKNFAIGISVLTTALTLISLSASYKTYLESFRDWGPFGRILAVGTTAGIELAFGLLVYGIINALIEWELKVAIFGALSLLGVMTTNFNVHSAVVKGQALVPWQIEWQNWIGAIVPFYTIGLLIFIAMTLHESRERRQERRINYLSKQRALDYKEEYLKSAEMEDQLADMKPMIEAEVKRHLALPAAKTSTNSDGLRVTHGPVYMSGNNGADWSEVGPAAADWNGPTGPPRPKP